MPPGEGPPGDLRPWPKEFMLVMLLAVSADRLDVYELVRPAEDTDDMEPCGMTLSLGVGDPRETPSRRRRRSLDDGMLCKGGPSPGGEDARRFCPIV